MSFGLFLVQNKVIDENTYLNALEEQYTTLPALLNILRNDLKVPNDQLLQIVKNQSEQKVSFLDAAKDVLGEATLNQAISAQNQKIKTIGEILIEKNIVDMVQIQGQIESYQSQATTTTNSTAATTEKPAAVADPSPATASADDDGEIVSQAAIDSMKEIFGDDSPEVKEMEAKLAASQSASTAPSAEPQVHETASNEVDNSLSLDQNFFKAEHELDQDFVSELILKFNAKEIVDLSKTIKDLPNAEDKAAVTADLVKRFHVILGASKQAGAKVLAESVKVLEDFLKSLSPENIDSEKADKIYVFYSLLVKLRNHIEQEKSEKGFFDDSSRQNEYESLRVSLS